MSSKGEHADNRMSVKKGTPLAEGTSDPHPIAQPTKEPLDATGTQPKLPEQPSYITHAKWLRLQQLSALEDGDRRSLDHSIDLYRKAQVEGWFDLQHRPSETRDQLERLAALANAFHIGINSVLENPIALKAITAPGDPEFTFDTLLDFSHSVERLSVLCGHAGFRIEDAPPGPKNRNLHYLVESLALTWTKRTGAPLSVSKKRIGPDASWNALEFIMEATKLADPALSDADQKITDLVKSFARRMRDQER